MLTAAHFMVSCSFMVHVTWHLLNMYHTTPTTNYNYKNITVNDIISLTHLSNINCIEITIPYHSHNTYMDNLFICHSQKTVIQIYSCFQRHYNITTQSSERKQFCHCFVLYYTVLKLCVCKKCFFTNLTQWMKHDKYLKAKLMY